MRGRPTGEASEVAYLFLDLDGFKRVNDTLGHSAGDHLLGRGRGRGCAGWCREGDVAARIGGDEFLIVAALRRTGRRRRRSASRLIAALAGRALFLFGGAGVDIGVSVGIALSRRVWPAPSPT